MVAGDEVGDGSPSRPDPCKGSSCLRMLKVRIVIVSKGGGWSLEVSLEVDVDDGGVVVVFGTG